MANQTSAPRGGAAPVRRGPGGPRGGPGGHRIENAKDFKGTMLRLLKYFGNYKWLFFLVSLIVVGQSLINLVYPYLTGRIIDDAIGQQNLDALGRLSLTLLIAYLVGSLLQFFSGFVMATISQNILRKLRQELFNHLQTLSLSFFDRNQTGDLMSRLTNDVDAINRALSQNITQLISDVFITVGVLAAMLILNFWLTLTSMLVIPLMVLVTGRIAIFSRRYFRALQGETGELNAVMEETISGQRAVKIFRRNESAMQNFEQQNSQVRDTSIKAHGVSSIMPPLMGVLGDLSVAIIMGVGGFLAVKGFGGVTVGMIAAFIGYNRTFMQPLRSIADIYNALQSALAGAERVFAILDTKAELFDIENAVPMSDINGEVVFNDVNFGYDKDVPVMKDVNMFAKPGQTIALVGPTGAGKTTTINLLTRFYDIDSGSIYIDGNEIKTIKIDDLRRNLGIVLQDNFLFSGTVKENIRYGKLDATDEEIYEAARLANADSFIRRLPEGYDTELSERANNLSQGQRQLISIARAILADPKILILDEATSSVDTRTEKHIQAALLHLMEGRTAFVIAHRLSTIRTADQVLVVNGGEIIERGTHEELLDMKGFYYNLYMSQFKGKSAEELGISLN